MEIAIPQGAVLDIDNPVLMWQHGAQTTATQPFTNSISTLQQMIINGWIVVSCNAGITQPSWGYPSARDGVLYDLQWCLQHFHPYPPGLYGVSMGGLTSLGLMMDASRNGLPIQAFLGNSPVTHLAQQYDTNATERGDMKARYGITESGTFGSPALYSNGAQYQAKVEADGAPYFGHDPQVDGGGHARPASDFLCSPFGNAMYVQLWEGNYDTIVRPSLNAVLLAQKLRDAGWTNVVEVQFGTNTTNGGHVGSASTDKAACDAQFGPGGFFKSAFGI